MTTPKISKVAAKAFKLMKGSSPEFIKKIQGALKGLGLYKGVVDGLYGDLSLAAVRNFQRIHRLKQDGVVGPITWKELFPDLIPDREIKVKPPAPIIHPATPPGFKSPWPRQQDVGDFYGTMGANLVMMELPYPMKLAWNKRTIIHKFSIHKKVMNSAFECLAEIEMAYGKDIPKLGLDIFGGCLNVRKMRGGTNWSMHSWAIAIDFDPENNLLQEDHTKARFAKPEYIPFWEIWERHGWLSLGRTRDYDWMHVQAAQL